MRDSSIIVGNVPANCSVGSLSLSRELFPFIEERGWEWKLNKASILVSKNLRSSCQAQETGPKSWDSCDWEKGHSVETRTSPDEKGEEEWQNPI